MNAQPKLLDQVKNRLRLKHYSLRTEDTYVHPNERAGSDQRTALIRRSKIVKIRSAEKLRGALLWSKSML
jgi:hypothetical protein